MNKKNIFLLCAIVLFAICGILYNQYMNSTAVVINNLNPPESGSDIMKEETEDELSVTIYICGEVVNEGVYTLKAGSRIVDALEIAGGASDEADLLRVNLAEILYDSQQIIIPKTKTEAENQDSAGDESALININTANADKLKTLPGIGDSIAGAIIDYRETNGNFKKIEDIKDVPKIGNGIFENIKALITI